MNYFLNLQNGTATINAYRNNGVTTDVDDILNSFDEESSETLNACINDFIKSEAAKIMDVAEACETNQEMENFVFGEGDFLEEAMSRLNIELGEYPELRDIQREQFEDLDFES